MISFLVSVVKDFAELVSDKYKAMMMKLSLQITGSREDAEEAVQDALLSVHRNQRKITDIISILQMQETIFTRSQRMPPLRYAGSRQNMILMSHFLM